MLFFLLWSFKICFSLIEEIIIKEQHKFSKPNLFNIVKVELSHAFFKEIYKKVLEAF